MRTLGINPGIFSHLSQFLMVWSQVLSPSLQYFGVILDLRWGGVINADVVSPHRGHTALHWPRNSWSYLTLIGGLMEFEHLVFIMILHSIQNSWGRVSKQISNMVKTMKLWILSVPNSPHNWVFWLINKWNYVSWIINCLGQTLWIVYDFHINSWSDHIGNLSPCLLLLVIEMTDDYQS